MKRTTESLSYPANPLAAIRELHDLDVRPPAVPPAPGAESSVDTNATALPRALATGSEVVNPVASEVGSATTHVRPRAQLSEPRPRKAESKSRVDPMRTAVRELLAQPYSAEPDEGPFTVSTVKIPTEVWERLGWVSLLTGRPKQEILTAALRDHFDKILGEV